MVYIALVALVVGIIIGQVPSIKDYHFIFSAVADYMLYLLMFCVGISVGLNETILEKIRHYNASILYLPLGVIIGSVFGGIICGFIFDRHLSDSISIGGAMGWYSLSGVMLESLSCSESGTIAFLSNLMREFLAFITIPLLVKYLNPYTAIAAAGATSEDTTLPMMMKYTSEEFIIISVINGVLCSIAVPFIINFSFSFFN